MESYAKSILAFAAQRAREAGASAGDLARSLLDVATARARARAAEQREEVLSLAFAAEHQARLDLERGTTIAHQRIEAINAGTRRRLNALDAELEKTRAARDEARRIGAERLAELTRTQERVVELERQLNVALGALDMAEGIAS